jgi:hypothetical protein
MNLCIGYAKPEDWIPAARNERSTGGEKGKVGIDRRRAVQPNSKFCCKFATPVKSVILRCNRQV